MENIKARVKKWLLKFLGLENAESNLMILHKKTTAAESTNRKHYVRIKRLETK